jgi:hypothetical protein
MEKAEVDGDGGFVDCGLELMMRETVEGEIIRLGSGLFEICMKLSASSKLSVKSRIPTTRDSILVCYSTLLGYSLVSKVLLLEQTG